MLINFTVVVGNIATIHSFVFKYVHGNIKYYTFMTLIIDFKHFRQNNLSYIRKPFLNSHIIIIIIHLSKIFHNSEIKVL